MTALAALICRDIRIALRAGGGALIGVLFFVTVVVVMPFALGPELPLLKRIGPAILWLGAMLASLLTLDRLFTADMDDGSLDVIAMSRTPLELTCAAEGHRALARRRHSLIVATPLAGILLNLEAQATFAVMLTLLVGTPALTFIGMIGAGLRGHPAPGWIAARRGRVAAINSRPDFRGRGLECGHQQFGTIRHAIFDPLRLVPCQFCGRAIRCSRQPSAGDGLMQHKPAINSRGIGDGAARTHCLPHQWRLSGTL